MFQAWYTDRHDERRESLVAAPDLAMAIRLMCDVYRGSRDIFVVPWRPG